jgi:excisionase family DNA binding protein
MSLLGFDPSVLHGSIGARGEKEVDVVDEGVVARVVPVEVVEAVNMPKRRPFVGDRLLTVGEVAATMRVSNMTVYRLIKAGQLAAIRVGKNYRIRESDVNRYLSDRSVRVEASE